MTTPFAEVIGDPIAQSKSPKIHGFWLDELGIAAEYRACHVRPDDLEAYISARRADPLWRGCNVTMPHKQAVMGLLDGLSPIAARIGAVNTVVRCDGVLTGHNTDGPGFAEALGDVGRQALVLGAGGAARAIVVALADAGCDVTLAARDVQKAQSLLDELVPDRPMLAAPLGRFADGGRFSMGARGVFDLVVNASSLGMVGNPPLEFDLAHVRDGGTVYDIVTAPLETPLLARARARGLRNIDGLAMLIGQAAVAFELFFHAAPLREDGDAALRALLTA